MTKKNLRGLVRGSWLLLAAFLAGAPLGCDDDAGTGPPGVDGSVSDDGSVAGAGGLGTGGAATGGTAAGGSGTGGTATGGTGGTASGGASAGGAGGTGTGGAGGSGGASAAATYSGCMLIGGINRFVIAKRDPAKDLCVVLLLSQPGSNPFPLTLPANWGMEFAFQMPLQANCLVRFPPSSAVQATAGSGSVAMPMTPTPTANVDVTLRFPAPSSGGAMTTERLMVNGVVAPLGCPQ